MIELKRPQKVKTKVVNVLVNAQHIEKVTKRSQDFVTLLRAITKRKSAGDRMGRLAVHMKNTNSRNGTLCSVMSAYFLCFLIK